MEDWTLLISKYGTFWAITKLSGGLPAEAVLFHAKNGALVEDFALVSNIATTDTSLNELDFWAHLQEDSHRGTAKLVDVIEVQHGESWDDYRPARPQDFVGRKKTIDKVFGLFTGIRKAERSTRVFALTGNSGMGKSSLISKIRDKSNNRHHRERVFVFAVDLRAATSSDYVFSSLLACLQEAQSSGFGDPSILLRITDLTNPLLSPAIKDFLRSLGVKDQLICLVFDQFEELSSKPDLFPVFVKAKALFLGTNSTSSNFCMGFAWKTDITVAGDNPAYHLWHELDDLRVTFPLLPFTDGECNAVLNIFEKVIGQKLYGDLRHNLSVISQGYPWLLKKLCIHLHGKIDQGANQEQLIESRLDVKKLFDDDLQRLSVSEKTCLDYIASNAPIDVGEIVELFDEGTIQALVNSRLVIKSGHRLNIYWDIFREYLLTGSIPEIPLHYLPINEFPSVAAICKHLSQGAGRTLKELANATGWSQKTVLNLSSDLVMFEIADREGGKVTLRADVGEPNEQNLLTKARQKLRRHAVTIALHQHFGNAELSMDEALNLLRHVYQNDAFAEATWRTYTLRLLRWLEFCGLVVQKGSGWLVRDLKVVSEYSTSSVGSFVEFRAKRRIYRASTPSCCNRGTRMASQETKCR
jgi:hypothetical protein